MNSAAELPIRSARPLISVVVPVFNEAAVLGTLLARLEDSLTNCGVEFEAVLVNDGSHDDSPAVLDAFAQKHSWLRVVHLSRNFGHQAAVQAGLAHARGDAVVLMDADLQDSPEALPRLIDKWQDGFEVVYAIRRDRKENVAKRFLFAAFHRLMSRVSSTKMPADAGNFGLIDSRVVREIVALGERDRYLPGLRSWVGFRQTGIEVERNARYDKKPRVSLKGLCRLAKTAVFSFSTFPLAVFSWIGYLAMGIFVALAGFSLYCKLFTDLAIPGWSSHILSASFFGALNALGISILGEYVIRIYDQVRGRPLYLVARTANIEPEVERQTKASPADESYRDLLAQANELLEMATSGKTEAAWSDSPAMDRR